MARLKKALAKDDDEPWDDRKGPFKGVRRRGGTPPAPPQWKYDATDLRAYNKFCKKVQIWMLQVSPYLTKWKAALSLYNALQEEAEQELEHTPVEEIYTDNGVETILQALKAPMEQKAIYQKRRYLNNFEHIRRYQGETMRSYINRFTRVQRSLRSVGINIEAAYDNESMGSRLLDRSGLSHEQQRMILVATQQSLLFEAVVEALNLQFPEFRGAPPIAGGKDGGGKGKSKTPGQTSSSTMSSPSTSSTASSRTSSTGFRSGSTPKRAFVAAHNDEADEDAEEFLDPIEEEEDDEQQDDEPNDQQDDYNEYDEDDEQETGDLQELASVLTVIAKKLSNLTLGRKFFTNAKKGKGKGKSSNQLSPEEQKKITHCTACGDRGHWYRDPECPKNKGKGSSFFKSAEKKGAPQFDKKPHSVNFIHHDHGTIDVYDNPSHGQSFEVNMVAFPSLLYEINEVQFIGSEKFAGLLVLDSGCQKTCCGQAWIAAYEGLLKEHGLQTVRVPNNEYFKFGKGAPSTSTTRVYMPSALSEVPFLLGAALLDEDIPFLGSNSLFTSLGAHLHFQDNYMEFDVLEVSVPVQRVAGYMVVNILDFVNAHLHFQDNYMEFDVLGVSVPVQRVAGYMIVNILDFVKTKSFSMASVGRWVFVVWPSSWIHVTSSTFDFSSDFSNFATSTCSRHHHHVWWVGAEERTRTRIYEEGYYEAAAWTMASICTVAAKGTRRLHEQPQQGKSHPQSRHLGALCRWSAVLFLGQGVLPQCLATVGLDLRPGLNEANLATRSPWSASKVPTRTHPDGSGLQVLHPLQQEPQLQRQARCVGTTSTADEAPHGPCLWQRNNMQQADTFSSRIPATASYGSSQRFNIWNDF